MSVSIGSDGKVAIAEPDSDPAQLECIGPGTQRIIFGLRNDSPVSHDISVTASLAPGLLNPDGCTATLGTCMVPDSSTVTWMATVSPMQGGELQFPATIAFGTPANTTLCITYSFFLDTVPISIPPLCLTTTTAGSCGVGAPALDGRMLALLIGVLAVGGLLSLRWRRA